MKAGVLRNPIALWNCVHQYASSPVIDVSQNVFIYCSVERRFGGLDLMRTYTRAGKVSSAPGGSPHLDSCRDLMSNWHALMMHFNFPLGD